LGNVYSHTMQFKRNTALFSILFILILAIDGSVYGQLTVSTKGIPACASDQLLLQSRNDPHFLEEEKKMNTAIRNKILFAGQKNQPAVTYTIPVVFHIITSNPNSITDKMVMDALKELNDAFAHRSPYNIDPGGADTKIQFCLARTRPDGGLTSGIDRAKTFLGQHDMDMEGDKPGSLMDWDRSRYVNIWVVEAIQAEIMQKFTCGKWRRIGVGGYAGAGSGVVVSGLATPLVAHEMGHYLSLLHTFAAMDCRNNDCTTDGDLVCDTPPDASIDSSPCNSPDNSCNTDTLSGPFKVDTTDNISNFMDYGSPCPSVFTQGQADRMRAFLENFNGGSLLTSDRCNLPCSDNINASFNWDGNPFPVTGSSVTFNNTSTGATSYKWYLNNADTGSNKDLTISFNSPGKYNIRLVAFNSSKNCFSTYEGNINVNCGVYARFSPDKRIIAADQSIYPDSVYFWNKSYGATDFKWFISDNPGNGFSLVSTSKDITYRFPKAGNYSIQLVASNGSCADTSRVFLLPVLDPTPDAILSIKEIDCYKNDSIRIVFSVVNNGYDTIPAGIPVNFYDRATAMAGKQLLKPMFQTDTQILGKCEIIFTHIVKANSPKLNQIGAIIDEGNTIREISETNNAAVASNFQSFISLTPSDTLVYVNTDVALQLSGKPKDPVNFTWQTSSNISCISCLKPVVRITDSTIVSVVNTSKWGCRDTLSSMINVYPIDISLKTNNINCYHNDSLLIKSTICLGNGYNSLKKDIEILYFDNDTLTGPFQYLGKIIIPANTAFITGCAEINHQIKMTKTGKVFSYINSDLRLFEFNTGNNNAFINYIPFSIKPAGNKLDVFRGTPTQLQLIQVGEPFKTLTWTPANLISCQNCLNPVFQSNTNATLKAVATTEYACIDSALIMVNVFYQQHIILPNVFTPDGDGKNDYFYVISGTDVVSVQQFQIFNRWGEKVFEKNNVRPNEYSGGWDGNYKGQKAAAGTYVYMIKLKLQNGSTEIHKGNITILR